MPTIAIVGGGIGGLTLYHALRRRGLEAEVYEAAPLLHEVGAGIVLPSNGMQVLDRLGLAEAVVQQGTSLHRAEIHDLRVGLLQRIDLAPIRKRFGYGMIGIHRAALQRILATGVPAEHLHLGKRCTSALSGDDGVDLQFADGARVRASIVVAADGARSAIRQSLFPESRLQYAGEAGYRGVATITLPRELGDASREIWGNGCRFGFVGIGDGRVYWFAAVKAAPGGRGAPDQVAEQLRRLAVVFPEPIPRLVAATPPDALVHTDLYDLSPLKTWHCGRVVLLGDAAHAMTPNLGQGAAQAIEDAYVLAEMLAREATRPTPEKAFAAFQKVRMARARTIVRQSRLAGEIASATNPALQCARTLAFRATPPFVMRRNLDRLFRLAF